MAYTRRLYKLSSTPVGYGTDGINSVGTFELAIDQGYRVFDTADLYRNADALSDAIRQSNLPREEFCIIYKIFPKLDYQEFKAHVNAAINKFEYIDCLMLHDMHTNTLDELKHRLEFLRGCVVFEERPIRQIGVSNIQYSLLADLLKEFPEIKLVQNPFNHLQQDAEVLDLCRKNRVHYMGYGLFGGKYDGSCTFQFNPAHPGWNLSELLFPVINEMAVKYHTSLQVILLTWAILQNTIQIPRATSKENMIANLQALKISKQMKEEDKIKLNDSLNIQFTPAEWEAIEKQAEQNEPLARIKMMVGNYKPRHQLVELLYRDDALKVLFDLLLDKDIPAHVMVKKSDNTYVQRWLREDSELVHRASFPRTQNNGRISLVQRLTHFIEMALKEGNGEIDKCIESLKCACEKSISLSDKTGIFELIHSLGDQHPYSDLFAKIGHYNTELSILENSGCFEIKELEFQASNEERNSRARLLNIGVVGNDNIIYIIRKIPTTATLDDLKKLLTAKVPDDFKDLSMLESFYIPDKKQNMTSHATQNLNDLWIAQEGVIGAKDKQICTKLFGLFHSVTDQPEAFTKDRFYDLTTGNKQ